jgi:hypothetical protein
MESFDVALYTRTSQVIGGILAMGTATRLGQPLINPNTLLSVDGANEKLLWLANDLGATIEPLGFAIAMDSIRTMQEIAVNPASCFKDSTRIIDEFVGRLHAHLENTLFFYVPPERVRFYEKLNLFGDDVALRFSSVLDDAAEAAKCFALDRYTACVFHLTRVLQVGLYALAKDLAIDPADRNWGLVINDIEKEIKSRTSTRSPTMSRAAWDEDNKFYAGAAMQFEYIRLAFRNDAIHKTGEMFMPDKARSIFDHARDFMQHLATRLSE